MWQYFRELILVCIRHKSVARRKKLSNREKKLSYMFIHCTLFQYFVETLLCLLRGHLRLFKINEISNRGEKKTVSRRKIERTKKGNIIGFVRLLNENVSFISLANVASSSFIRLTFIILIIICVYFRRIMCTKRNLVFQLKIR